jgi:glucans biosynthesis protein
MHGRALGSGAPKGSRNALRHGRYTAQAIAMRREMRALLRRSRELIESI